MTEPIHAPVTAVGAYFDLGAGAYRINSGTNGAANSQVMGWSSSLLMPVLLSVDASGNLLVSGSGGGGGSVTVTNFPAVQPVSGTFWQTTQPISAANLDVALSTRLKPADTLAAVTSITNPVAVTGTFWQATQPISGAVSFTAPQHVIVDSSSAIAVTGPLTDTQLRATAVPISAVNLDVALSTRLKPADTLAGVTAIGSITTPVAVTGTFWQVTQPVSGAFFQATQPVSAVALPLPANAAQESSGNLAIIAGQVSDLSDRESLKKIVDLLSFISLQLTELPANLSISLNKGIAQTNADTFENYISPLN